MEINRDNVYAAPRDRATARTMALVTPGIGNRIFMSRTRTFELKSPYNAVRVMGEFVHVDRRKIRSVEHIVREILPYVRCKNGKIVNFGSARVDFVGWWW